MHFAVFVGGRVQSGSSDEEALHHKTGTVLSLHLLLHEDSRIRPSRIRHAEVFQSIASLGAPDGAYVGSQWIHRAGSGTGPVDSPVDLSGDTARFGIGISDEGLLLRHILQVQPYLGGKESTGTASLNQFCAPRTFSIEHQCVRASVDNP